MADLLEQICRIILLIGLQACKICPARLVKRGMQTPLVVTLLGADKPGLVEMVAQVVSEHGGNWLESRMARLGGQFAGILRVSILLDKREILAQALLNLQEAGLRIQIEPDESEAIITPAAGAAARLSLVGQDRPGIVRQISQTLSRNKINVEELSTECSSAPMSGEILFHAEARIQIPASCALHHLQSELEKVAADLMVDLKLEPLKKV